MSVSQFPNASLDTMDKIMDQLENLIPDPSLHSDIETIISAYVIASIEMILASPKIRNAAGPFDPLIEADIRRLIDSCR